MTGRAPDDLRDSLAVAAALRRTGRSLQIERAPEEALWLLGSDASPLEPSQPSSRIRHAVVGRAARDRLLRLASPAGDHLVIDGGPHGYQNGGHAHADALSLTLRASAACRC